MFAFEKALVYHCSPTLSGLKPANLLSLSKRDYPHLPELAEEYSLLLSSKGIQLEIVCSCGQRWLLLVFRKRSSFCKHVLYQVVTLALLAVIFDLMTGFLRWSFDYVIPALCAFAMIVIGITSIIRRQHITDYIIYMVLSSVFGIVPLLFLLPGWTTVTWPTVLTAAAGIIYLAALLLFVGRDTWRELRRRLHL